MRKRNRHKIIIGIEVMILSITVSLLGPNAASANPPSNGVSYNKNGQVTVENALDNLYSKANYGDATAGDILKGKKALVGGKEVVGTFTCPTLASLTPGDATPEDIIDGKIAWVNGNRIVGTYNPPTPTPTPPMLSLAEKVALGDYIRYTPIKTSYTVSKEDTAYKEDQIIDPSELNLWRVIRKNTNGTVDIVSENVSSKGVIIGNSNSDNALQAYKNYIGTLNKIAKQYETEGITVGSRHIGYGGGVPYLDKVISTGNPDDGYKEDLQLLTESIGSFGKKRGLTYWLASRASMYGSGDYSFRVMTIQSGGYVEELDKYTDTDADIVYDDYPLNLSYDVPAQYGGRSPSVRPIVVLRSTLNITSGKGTENSPYTLGT